MRQAFHTRFERAIKTISDTLKRSFAHERIGELLAHQHICVTCCTPQKEYFLLRALEENFSHYSIFRSSERMENGKNLIIINLCLVCALWKLLFEGVWLLSLVGGENQFFLIRDIEKHLGIFMLWDYQTLIINLRALRGIIIRWNSIKNSRRDRKCFPSKVIQFSFAQSPVSWDESSLSISCQGALKFSENCVLETLFLSSLAVSATE